MSILDKNSIDIVNIENEKCVLIITDHLKWDDGHLNFLKDKINLYLHYIGSGQIYINTPEAKGKDIIIKLIYKFMPNRNDAVVLEKIKEALYSKNIIFIYEVAS